MAKKKKKPQAPEGQPLWLITFSDLMTLMLTFFVLLVSMSVIDERRKLIVLGSIIGTFGFGTEGYDVLSTTDTKRSVSVGPMEFEGDLEPIKPLLWEYAEDDLRFESNRFVQVLSIGSDVLFTPSSTTLSNSGQKLLSTVLPILKKSSYPILLAGHTSLLRDELGEDYKVEEKDKNPDLSWKISMARVLSVYNFLVRNGISTENIKLEAFGKFRPKFTNDDKDGRKKNRRVDIVLDKRNTKIHKEIKSYHQESDSVGKDVYKFEGFSFPVNKSSKTKDN